MKRSILMIPVGARHTKPSRMDAEQARSLIRRVLEEQFKLPDAAGIAELQVSNIMKGKIYSLRNPGSGRLLQFMRIMEVRQ